MASALHHAHEAGFVFLSEADDDVLVEVSRTGSNEALDVLIGRYRGFARQKAQTLFLLGADREDLIQEGMIGLFKAIRDFDSSRGVVFRAFAELCITRQIISAIKAASRQKHGPLNSYVSFHQPISLDDDGEREFVELLVSSRVVDPIDLVVAQDEAFRIREFLGSILSDFESEVLTRYLHGQSYQLIAEACGRRPKAIDNALQRVKRKLETFLHHREAEAESAGATLVAVR